MIGFEPNETDIQEYGFKSTDPASKPSVKEVPSVKPDKEITTPNPSSVPSPQPDTIESSPSPEINPIPTERPITSPSPEISPIEPVEFS